MGFQTPITICDALGAIEGRQYVLPAIQREFVWRPEQIQCLFDSLMRGYPIGSFLFWIVKRESITKYGYKFYDFMLDYHESNNPHCKPIGAVTRDEVVAVLDGQQRLTGLNIGLRGSYAYKLPRLWWKNKDAFPKRKLYLNLLADAEENEQNMQYDFRFLTNEEAERRDETHCWYPVGEILQVEEWQDLNYILVNRQLGNEQRPGNVLGKLQKVVHTDPVIAHYKEDDQKIDKVLDIFIRTNSGGTTLSYSDMLMSIATAHWKLDAREAIHSTVDEINGIGRSFAFTQDFLLKAGLMLAGVRNVRFRVTNFDRNNMKLLEENWDRITSAVRTAVELVARFGFSQASLSANYAVLPIAHYLYSKDKPTGFLSQSQYRQDRDDIRDWLLRSLLKRGIWGSGLDSLLTSLRSVIDSHGAETFPSAKLKTEMRTRGKSLAFEEEEIEDLVESKDRTFALLSVLYPFVDLQGNRFHIDHVFPKSRFTRWRLREAGVAKDEIDKFVDRVNRLPNLQFLTGEANESKRDRLPHEWIANTFNSEEACDFVNLHDLGEIPTEITGFSEFYEARRDRLRDRLRVLLCPDRRDRGTS